MNAAIFVGLPRYAQNAMILKKKVNIATELTDINTFINFICDTKQIEYHTLLSNKRDRDLVEARQWICYYYTIHQRETKQPIITLSEIGATINRDHATVLHSIRAVENLINTDKVKREEFENLYEQIKIEYAK